jgi:hypothetical protein
VQHAATWHALCIAHVLARVSTASSCAAADWCLCTALLLLLQVVNCVGLLNYKFFLQFLTYTFIASVMAIACLVKPMLTFFQGTVASG